MRQTLNALGLIGMATALSACGSTGLFDRERPDEFAVSRQAPLVIPPDFGLSPPNPGAPRPQATDPAEEALEALFGGPQARSRLETDALALAGNSAPGIRTSVGDPDTMTVNLGTVTRDVIAAPEGDGQVARAVVPQS